MPSDTNIIDFQAYKKKKEEEEVLKIVTELYEMYGEAIFEEGVIQVMEKPSNDNIPTDD